MRFKTGMYLSAMVTSLLEQQSYSMNFMNSLRWNETTYAIAISDIPTRPTTLAPSSAYRQRREGVKTISYNQTRNHQHLGTAIPSDDQDACIESQERSPPFQSSSHTIRHLQGSHFQIRSFPHNSICFTTVSLAHMRSISNKRNNRPVSSGDYTEQATAYAPK